MALNIFDSYNNKIVLPNDINGLDVTVKQWKGSKHRQYIELKDLDGRAIILLSPENAGDTGYIHAGGASYRIAENGYNGDAVWLGRCAPRYFVCFGEDLEETIESAAEWAADNAPGYLVEDSLIHTLYKEAFAEGLSERAAQEQATQDMIYTESGYIESEDLGVFKPSAEVLSAATVIGKMLRAESEG